METNKILETVALFLYFAAVIAFILEVSSAIFLMVQGIFLLLAAITHILRE